MLFQQESASPGKRLVGTAEYICDLLVSKYIELSEQKHHQLMACAVVRGPDILMDVPAALVLSHRPLASVLDRDRREVDANTPMPQTGKPVGVQTRPAAEIENSARPATEERVMNPQHLQFDALGSRRLAAS